MTFIRGSFALALVFAVASCGKSGEPSGEPEESGDSGESEESSGESEQPGASEEPSDSETSPPAEGEGPGGVIVVPGDADTSVETALPPLAQLPGVTAGVVGDSVNLTVIPVEGARDYRVYVLPPDDAITATDDGHVTIEGAIYRCGGDRQAASVGVDGVKVDGQNIMTLVDNQEAAGFTRQLEDATLGHVYVSPGEGRIPVYALGDPGESADNRCFGQRWNESRVKRYVTSEATRDELIAEKWRDDGVAFYVPSSAEGAHPVYFAQQGDDRKANLFYVDGPEAEVRSDGTAEFNVLTEAASDTQPLMRVHYFADCGRAHDELVPGLPRFERARFQGDKLPIFDLHWSGITEETTLVVEALDQGCPYGGAIGPSSRPAGTEDGIDYPVFITLEEAIAASATGEVFLNGHHDSANKPRPIARSFVKVSPAEKPDMDWFTGFGADEVLPDFANSSWDEPCGKDNCLAEYRQKNDLMDMTFGSVTKERFAAATVLGELWVMYADVGADVGGKFRMTPNTRATLADDTYVHITMEVSAFTTARRYPQIFVSDAEPPVQWNLPTANTVVIETFPDLDATNWPAAFVMQICDHRPWEVNDQCPAADLYRLRADSGEVTTLGANPELSELTGVDRSTRFDVYISTRRSYLFADNKPYGCIDMPQQGVPAAGPVTITYGDVLYHSGVDPVFSYYEDTLKVASARHYDNLGFKSGVEGPRWDEQNLPCFPASTFGRPR
jgi:hypothetical protein